MSLKKYIEYLSYFFLIIGIASFGILWVIGGFEWAITGNSALFNILTVFRTLGYSTLNILIFLLLKAGGVILNDSEN